MTLFPCPNTVTVSNRLCTPNGPVVPSIQVEVNVLLVNDLLTKMLPKKIGLLVGLLNDAKWSNLTRGLSTTAWQWCNGGSGIAAGTGCRGKGRTHAAVHLDGHQTFGTGEAVSWTDLSIEWGEVSDLDRTINEAIYAPETKTLMLLCTTYPDICCHCTDCDPIVGGTEPVNVPRSQSYSNLVPRFQVCNLARYFLISLTALNDL